MPEKKPLTPIERWQLQKKEAAERAAKKAAAAEKPAQTPRVQVKKPKKVDFSIMIGPAGAGQHGGGKEAPVLPPTVGVKTNPKGGHGFGPQKGASGSKKSHDSGKKSQKQKEQERKKGGKGKK